MLGGKNGWIIHLVLVLKKTKQNKRMDGLWAKGHISVMNESNKAISSPNFNLSIFYSFHGGSEFKFLDVQIARITFAWERQVTE